jgi:hypothetical protein
MTTVLERRWAGVGNLYKAAFPILTLVLLAAGGSASAMPVHAQANGLKLGQGGDGHGLALGHSKQQAGVTDLVDGPPAWRVRVRISDAQGTSAWQPPGQAPRQLFENIWSNGGPPGLAISKLGRPDYPWDEKALKASIMASMKPGLGPMSKAGPAAEVVVTPLPAPLLLFASGLVSLALAVRRRGRATRYRK